MNNYDILIVGTGGLTQQCLGLILEKYKNPAFFDNVNNDKNSIDFLGNSYPIFHNFEIFRMFDKYLILISDPKTRKKITEKINNYSYIYNNESLISEDFINKFNFKKGHHWFGIILSDSICENGVSLSSGLLINTRCSIHHGSKIGEYVTLSPNVTILGDCEIGDETFIGAGAIVKEKTKIGKNCIIGMGSVVLEDIPDNSIAWGNPCKVIRKNR